MAEVVGTVSAAIGIADFAAQIGSGVFKIKAFFDDIKDAPEDIQYVMLQVETLRSILNDIEDYERKHQFPAYVVDSTNVKNNLRLCQDVLQQLEELIGSLDLQMTTGTRFRRTFGAVKSTLKKEQISKIQGRLKAAIDLMKFSHSKYHMEIINLQFSRIVPSSRVLDTSSLNLTASNAILESTQGSFESPVDLDATSILSTAVDERSNLPRSSQETHKSSSWWVIGNRLLGIVNYRTETISTLVEQRSENHASRIYHPTSQYTWFEVRSPSWALNKAWEASYQRTCGQWKLLFRAYNIVTFSSPVVGCIRTGNLKGVRDLFSRGEATPWDRTSLGRTLFEYTLAWVDLHLRPNSIQLLRLFQEQFGSLESNSVRSVIRAPFWPTLSRHVDFDEIQVIVKTFLETSDDYDPLEIEATLLARFVGTLDQFLSVTSRIHSGYFDRPQVERTFAVLGMTEALVGSAQDPIMLFSALGLKTGVMGLDVVTTKDKFGETLLHKCAISLSYDLGPEYDYSATKTERNYMSRAIQYNTKQYVPSWTSDFRENWHIFTKLIVGAGADLHEVNHSRRSPMLRAFGGRIDHFRYDERKRAWKRNSSSVEFALRAWLEALVYAGVDLTEYGRREKEQHDAGLVNWDLIFWPDYQDMVNYGRPPACRIISFDYGPSPSDWRIWLSEPTDEYVGIFWGMIERLRISIPGAWEDDLFSQEDEENARGKYTYCMLQEGHW